MAFCGNCGNHLPDGAKFCVNCGQPAPQSAPIAPQIPPVEPPAYIPEPVQPPKKRSKAVLWIVLAAVALVLVAAVLLFFLLRCDHEWEDATCTEAEICQLCGKTQGEATGHDWQDADCEKPETCENCGETEGKPLGHEWSEGSCTVESICETCGKSAGPAPGHQAEPANYQDASVCSVCEEVLEEKLTPDMEKYGITDFMEVGKVYDFASTCYEDESYDTVGELSVVSYEILDTWNGYAADEGYEWRVAEFQWKIYDDNAQNYGARHTVVFEDYYNIDLLDDTHWYSEEAEAEFYTILWHGEEKEVSLYEVSEWSDWTEEAGGYYTIKSFTAAYHVPEGYDGAVYGSMYSGLEWPSGKHIYDLYDPETFKFFRFY